MPEQCDPDNSASGSQYESIPPHVKAYIGEHIQNAIKSSEEPKKKKWKNSWRSASFITKATLTMTLGIALATIGYAIISRFQLSEMQKTNELARPYVGVGMAAKVVQNPENLQFEAQFRNYGSVPAEGVTVTWIVVWDGVRVPISKVPDAPPTLFPTETTQLDGQVGTDNASSVLHGDKTLVIYTTDSYRWRKQQQTDYAKFQYAPMFKQFYQLGPICYPN